MEVRVDDEEVEAVRREAPAATQRTSGDVAPAMSSAARFRRYASIENHQLEADNIRNGGYAGIYTTISIDNASME